MVTMRDLEAVRLGRGLALALLGQLRIRRGRLRLDRRAAGARGVGLESGDRIGTGLAHGRAARLRGRRRRGRWGVGIAPVFLGDHAGQRIDRLDRIQVEDQAMPVAGHRCQGEHLRLDLFLQVEHEAHHVRPVLGDPHLADVGVVRLDLGDQAFQRFVERQALDVDHQARRIGHHEVRGLQLAVVFQRDAGVFVGRPDAHGEELGRRRRQGQGGREHGQQQGSAGLQHRAALRGLGDQGVGG
jgi:hypothetical protein